MVQCVIFPLPTELTGTFQAQQINYGRKLLAYVPHVTNCCVLVMET
jgi:hypothetical protein